MPVKGFPVILSSPSGGGKTTIAARLMEGDGKLCRVVTCTTRDPRTGEKDGVDYNFVSRRLFENRIKTGLMAEWAHVHAHYYGVPRRPLDSAIRQGKNPMLVIDVQGAMTIKKKYPDAVMVFIMPPSLKSLEKRLAGRNDNTDNVRLRLETARKEISLAGKYDYIVINDDLDTAVEDVAAVIRAERLRTARAAH